MNLGELLSQEARSLERQFDGSSEPDETYGAIRRRRAVRQGATAGVAVVGVGVIAFGGVRFALADHPESTPSATVGVDGSVTIDVTDATAFDPFAVTAQCGDAAPTPTDEVDGLQYVNRTADPVVLNPVSSDRVGTVPASILSSRTDSPTVSLSGVGFVWTQDGTVVAHSASPFSARSTMGYSFEPIEAGERTNIAGSLGAETYLCDSPATGPWTTIAAGTYEVYPVVRVVGSPSAAGWSRLVAEGTMLTPGHTPDPQLVVGSDACNAVVDIGPTEGESVLVVPRECATGADDPAEPSVFTVDYTAEDYTADLDALLVGEPLTVTINTSWQDAMAIRDARGVSSPVPADLQCGSEIPGIPDVVTPQLFTNVTSDDALDPVTEGDGSMFIASERLISPTYVTLAGETRLWLVGRGEVTTGSSVPEFSPIIGYATVRPQGTTPIALSVNHQYSWAPITITDLTMCEGAETEIYNWFLEGTVTWTDIEGTREIDTLPQ